MTVRTLKTAAATTAFLISLAAVAVPAQARGGGGYAGNSGSNIVGGAGISHPGGIGGGGFHGATVPDHNSFHAIAPQGYHGGLGGSCGPVEYDQWRRPIGSISGC